MNRVTEGEIALIVAASAYTVAKLGEKTTVVHMTLPNGFELVESSSCVDSANYDGRIGEDICKRRLIDKVWMLEGYRLQCDIAAGRFARCP